MKVFLLLRRMTSFCGGWLVVHFASTNNGHKKK